MEDRVTEHQKIDAEHDGDGRQIHDLGGNPQDRRQQRRGGGGDAILHGRDSQVAPNLVVQRQLELLVMCPHEQPLEREVDDEPDRKADCQRRLEGQADDISQHR